MKSQQSASERRGEKVRGLLTESQVHNLALTIFHVPSSLRSEPLNKKAEPSCRISSSVRLCRELKEPEGSKGTLTEIRNVKT